jgi:hypothetical protein
MFFSTTDIEAAYTKIKEKGFKPNSEIRHYPLGGRYFSVNDAGGNFSFIVQSWAIRAVLPTLVMLPSNLCLTSRDKL